MTLAGSTTNNGGADGVYSAASFSTYFMMDVDSSANIYIADWSNYRVRKVTPLGVVTTLAGSGVAGAADGSGAAATFNTPHGVAVSTKGVIYVADYFNNKIRAVTTAGLVSTFAGSGVQGVTDGTGISALLSYPFDVAVDSKGNVYSCDTNGFSRIRKISSIGVTSTWAGSTIGWQDGTGTTAFFSLSNCGLAVDSMLNLYVADYGNYRVRKVTSVAVVTTIAGQSTAGYANGVGSSALLNSPLNVAVDKRGNVYFTEYTNGVIRLVSSSGVVTTFAGATSSTLYTDGKGTAVRFSYPFGIAVDSSMNVYVSETSLYRLRKISQTGKSEY